MRSLLVAVALAACTLASAQVLTTRTFGTEGHPTQAIWTPDGQYVLVTVNGERGGGSGIEVFRVEGDKLKRAAFQRLGGGGAQGILVIPHTDLLAVGVSNAGVAFLPLDATLQGKADPRAIAQGDRSGSGYLAVTPDGQTLFVANEYGQGGNVGVIALRRDAQGKLAPEATAQIRTPHATPGIAISPDGSRLYAVSEVLPEGWPERILVGPAVPELQHDGCTQAIGRPSMPNGGLFVIDTAKAAALPHDFTGEQGRDAIRRLISAGCSPVREAVSSDGRTVYVTARGDNKVLAFDTAALEHDPAHAFLRAIRAGGEAPVGLALFDHDRKLLVADSNRFFNGPGNAAVIDLSDPAKPTILQTIKTGEFPRNITTSQDGRSLLLTVFGADELMLLTMK